MYMDQVTIKKGRAANASANGTRLKIADAGAKGTRASSRLVCADGEFDVGLIREFRARPVLYDRSCKRYKDKPYVAQQWQQISHKLGYDVSVLKERMLNLRNRYNIEKRRIESGVSTLHSQWPQFESLQFLSNHIRSRRSFKHMSKSGDDSYEQEGGMSDSNGQMTSVKDEMEDDDFDNDQTVPVTTVLTIPVNSSEDGNYPTRNQRQMLNGNNATNPTNGRCYSLSSRQQAIFISKVQAAAKRQAAEEKEDEQEEEEPPAKRKSDESRTYHSTATEASSSSTSNAYAKFHGFGEFMAHSLSELPLQTALLLVQKFTRELVQSTIGSQKVILKEDTDHGSDSEVED